MTGALVDGNAR
jgi:hypothetical protein